MLLSQSAAFGAPGLLRCEYLVNPLSVDSSSPRLSWVLNDATRGAVQTAYQIQVASSPGHLAQGKADLWDSGKVTSDATTHVVYAGTPVADMQRSHWRVRVWDGENQPSEWSEVASWGAGLSSQEDWRAAWVSEATPPPPDRPAHNGFHSAFAENDDVEKWVAVDLGASRQIDSVTLYPARPFDWAEAPGFLFPVRYRVEISDTEDFANARVVADQTAEDLPNPAMEPQTHTFDAQEARYVRLTVTKLQNRDASNFGFALAEMAVRLGDEGLALGTKVTASDSIEAGAWSSGRLVDGEVLAHPGGQSLPQPAALLRKDFRLDRSVRQATAYATALGAYEMRLNGQRVGDQILAPEWTDYDDRIQYQTYDVTDALREGENAIGVLLGDGWCVGRIGMSQLLVGKLRRVYRDKPAFLMRLHIVFDDGSSQDIVTDGSWRATPDGPVRVSDILDGEVYDARLEMDGWDQPGFDAGSWSDVIIAEPPDAALVAQPSEPLRIMEEITPVALSEPQPGVYVFDMGQNMVGWARLRLRAEAGTNVTLRHAEMLNPDGGIYMQNLRGAQQTDHYIARGDADGEVFEPHFTYHGFRYVEVTGLAAAPAQDDLVGCVIYSGAAQTGSFSCSDPMLNQLWRNVLWTQRANQFSVPTDCPQRDERLGWQGDIQAFAQTGIYNMDMAAFLTKCITDQRDAQLADGRFADFAPHMSVKEGAFTGVAAWGDAGVMVPWAAYVNYGDVRLLQEHYGAARRWVDYLHGKNPDLIWRQRDDNNNYGDWLNSDTFKNLDLPQTGGAVPQDVFATAFFARSAELVSKMAGVIGKPDDAKRYGALAQDIRKTFAETFIDAEGRIEGDTQAGYALALNFDLIPDHLREAAHKHMAAALERFGGRLSTGIQTTHRLMLELGRNGFMEEAYALAARRDVPSWGFMIEQGATTIWERWDGYAPGRGFQDPGMNSFNHWAFGAVAEWMHACILGLEPDPERPGYKHFFVRPKPGGGLTHATGTYDSIRGKISIVWRDSPEAFELDLLVPPNTTATVVLPGGKEVIEGDGPLLATPGVSNVSETAEGTSMEVSAGSYRFRVEK